MNEYLNVIQDLISSDLRINRALIVEEAEFTADLNLDSLDIMDIIMQVESKFNIVIAEHDVSDILSVGKLVEVIALKVSEK